MDWQEMDGAPRDGTQILVARHNDVFYEFVVVWWCGHETYPWESDNNAYPVDRFDLWSPIKEPAE
ncbi:hypothetical protein HFN98_24330 [Rhizobium laguerreae]|uniref:hypothetical protein n=1 Tax=Rhizobium laguerreae TaxID=1076926 RepID=UPI001C9020E3|nr:hypothetical protein [Rhizobium laguerreae]MBY3333723.1 hypothetical protein [Rhizobium laguerreae]